MFNANTVAKAKLVRSSKFNNLFKLVVAFNVTQRNSKQRYIFPSQQKCNYVSGDLSLQDLQHALNCAKAALHTNDIVLVK